MGLNDIYENNSKWLKAADLQGTKPVVEIDTAEVRENTYNGETKKQIVLTFTGKEKVLGLNFTNAQRISQLIGTEDFRKWVGWRIKLYTDQTKLQNGQTVDCIRIFPDLPEQSDYIKGQMTGPSDAVTDEDEIPF
ncbi:MAG: hypothetical protein KF855_03195 [Acidobacteria bacterium]|nr:hypothetical protein [Acidobacteriota bacterium]